MGSDMLNAICAEAETVTVHIEAKGSYDGKGDWIKGDVTEKSIQMSVQPASGQTILDAPEGVRSQIAWTVWTPFNLLKDTELVYEGGKYRVLHTWPRPRDGFVKAVIGNIK